MSGFFYGSAVNQLASQPYLLPVIFTGEPTGVAAQDIQGRPEDGGLARAVQPPQFLVGPFPSVLSCGAHIVSLDQSHPFA